VVWAVGRWTLLLGVIRARSVLLAYSATVERKDWWCLMELTVKRIQEQISEARFTGCISGSDRTAIHT
jgi:hypothetical protein